MTFSLWDDLQLANEDFFALFHSEGPQSLVSLLSEHNVTSSGRNVSSLVRKKSSVCQLEQAQQRGLTIETRHFNQQLSPVEMFNLREWLRLTY